MPTALLQELEAPAAGPVVELFPDVRRVLDRLRAARVGMAVVSDTWAGLEGMFRKPGHRAVLCGVSSSPRCSAVVKPDPRTFAAGRELLGLEPEHCLFVDDDPQLVLVAIQQGYRGAALNRSDGPWAVSVPTVTSLDEVLPIVVGR